MQVRWKSNIKMDTKQTVRKGVNSIWFRDERRGRLLCTWQ